MSQYQTGAFLYNGSAGPDQLNDKLAAALPVLSQNVEKLSVVQTTSRDDLIEKVRHYGEGVEVLYILGGDGTVHDCINAVADVENQPVLGILPGGTCNDFTRMLGIPQNVGQAAHALVNGRVAPVDLGQVGDRYFLNFWGIGLVTETSINIDPDQKNRFGVLSYFISAFKTMNEANTFRYKLRVDGVEYEEEGVMILVLNGRFIGTRQIPVPSLYVNDGNLDVLVIKNSNLKTFRELLSLNQPRTDSESFQELFHTQGKEIEIETDEEMDVDTDGEIYLKTPGSIKVLPNYLRMIMQDF
ncbi:YegS/Rv2252/BmrU family lipid kinase [Pontibacillus marinus]|uniref:Diacylglycerol kinase n=1 Tax=Pontibacillus marinus BH030004 = DSM 16465 TaxID=1385511 RepID=A0A0A5G9Q9_9BACI|nr:YegS/Rv2252/BmrU family lipid kinase [Pontibacillus marinus]KGX87850.1 diacylglycerol kinase [Pontibacillus marinus BH030004 = DSM 16465]